MVLSRAPTTARSALTVGREEALSVLHHQLAAGRSVVLTGPAGVGKTHLAQAAAAEQQARGTTVIEVLGASSAAAVPLGPFAHLVPSPAASVPLAGLIAATLEGIRRRTAAHPVLVVADDVDALDDASTLLVAHLVALERVTVLATVREVARLPRSLLVLVSLGRLHPQVVEVLVPAQVAALTAALAGSALDVEANREILQATGGNALWVTELLRAAVARRALRPGPRGLHLDTTAAVVGLDPALTGPLERLAADERETVELLAVGGPLPVELLEKLVGTGPIEAVAAAGILGVDGRGEGLTVRLAHPLHRDLLTGSVDGLRRRSLLRRLVGSAGDLGRSDPATRLRQALWHAELGETGDPAALGWAAQAVQWGQYELVRSHVLGIPPDPEVGEAGLATGLRTSRERSDVAHRLAKGAWHAERTFAHGLTLARALLVRPDRASEMVAVLDALDRLAGTDEERVASAVTHAAWLYWTVGDRVAAEAELRRAQGELDGPWHQIVASTRAGFDVQSGDIVGGLAVLEATTPTDDAPPAVRLAHATPLITALMLHGRATAALELAAEALPIALRGGNDGMAAMVEVLVSTSWAKLALGRSPELAIESRDLAELLAAAEDHEAGALFRGIEARCLLQQGRPASAAALLEEAIGRHGPFTTLGLLPLLHTTRAWALSWTGRAHEALAEVDEARRQHPAPRFFDTELELVEALALAGLGRRSRALSLARAAREQAMAAESWHYGYLAAHLVVRLTSRSEDLASLRDAAGHVDGAPAALAVSHGESLVAGDAVGLAALGMRAGELGDRLMEVEMLEVAASRVDTSGSRAVLARIEARLDHVRAECEGARSPLAPSVARPQGLTGREIEIVTLAARGWTSAAIALELVISVRTVESHLYRAFAKLGVGHRDELPAALAER